MKTKTLLTLCLLIISTTLLAQPKIIFDTDFGGDADDLGAIAMLHNLIDKGECEVLAFMSWQLEEYAVPGLDAINRYYKHPNIPIGTRKGPLNVTDWNHSRVIAESFPYQLQHDDAPDATVLYRQILSQSEDNSIVIITVGPLANIQNLIQSQGDNYSDLNGKELIEKKVKEFVIMGGQFPNGESEWNFNGDMRGVTRFVLDNLTVPITFSGYEVGLDIKTGEVFNEMDKNTPLYVGFKHFSELAPWIKADYKGKILDNSTYDQTAVLYAIRGGLGQWWEKVEGGYCLPDDTGGNKWVDGEVTNHSYLKLTVPQEEMAQLIEDIMLNNF